MLLIILIAIVLGGLGSFLLGRLTKLRTGVIAILVGLLFAVAQILGYAVGVYDKSTFLVGLIIAVLMGLEAFGVAILVRKRKRPINEPPLESQS